MDREDNIVHPDVGKDVLMPDDDILDKNGIPNSLKMWDDSLILNEASIEDLSALRKWLPVNSFHLIYRQSRDGDSPEAFQRKCGGKSFTLVVVSVQGSGQILGGFTDVTWDSRHCFARSYKSWLFAFTAKGRNAQSLAEQDADDKGDSNFQDDGYSGVDFDWRGPVRLPVLPHNDLTAICTRCDSGPAFGAAPDLLINGLFNKDGKRLSQCCAMISYRLPHEFSAKRSPYLAGTPTFIAEEVEVFQMIPSVSNNPGFPPNFGPSGFPGGMPGAPLSMGGGGSLPPMNMHSGMRPPMQGAGPIPGMGGNIGMNPAMNRPF